MAHKDDWRFMGQERYLQRATLRWKLYYRWSEDWTHDHCEFFAGLGSWGLTIRTKNPTTCTKATPCCPFLCSSLGQHHLSVREWDESKQMRELVSRFPRGPRSGADVGREVLAGEVWSEYRNSASATAIKKIRRSCHNRFPAGVSMSKPKETLEETWPATPGSPRPRSPASTGDC